LRRPGSGSRSTIAASAASNKLVLPCAFSVVITDVRGSRSDVHAVAGVIT
jgi:hypothetical protein